jgi:hypothetical protein
MIPRSALPARRSGFRPLTDLIVFTLVGILFISLGVRTWILNSRFDDGVIRVQGTIDTLIGDYGFLRRDFIRVVSYHYDSPEGRHQSTDILSRATWSVLRISHVIPVKYLPENPAICRIDLPQADAGYRIEVWIDLVVGIGLLASAGRNWFRS